MEYAWYKCFYEDEFNSGIRFFKNLAKWVLVNMPDLTLYLGPGKTLINIAIILVTGIIASAVIYDSIAIGFDLWLFVKLYLVSWIPGLLYSKMLAHGILIGIEKYQAVMRKIFSKTFK
ncbi:MAG TPA: hypothetical protein VMW25_00230 [Clostridia bacterium]|nr:hypothetical protein [Clostridia bacterium]